MGVARIRKLAAGPVQPILPEIEKFSIRLSKRAAVLLREGHERLTAAQKERKLPTVSFDSFLEHLMMAGLERLAQSMSGQQEPAPITQKIVVTPAEANREMVMADAVQDQRGRRTIGAVPMYHRRA